MDLVLRALEADEIGRVWTLDRTERIDGIFALVDGALILRDEVHDLRGWPAGQPEHEEPLLRACFAHGGAACGAFDGERLVGAAVLEGRRIGPDRGMLQLAFLHIGHGQRGRGLGRRLFEWAAGRARDHGAQRLYISATPSRNTVGFYLGLGCRLTADVDPELFALEPEDLHLEYRLSPRRT